MEWWQFGLDVVRVIIWPAVIVGLALWLGRDEIRSFMRRLRKGGAFGTTWELDAETSSVADAAESSLEAVSPAKAAEVRAVTFGKRLPMEPAAEILDAWGQIERMLEVGGGLDSYNANLEAVLADATQGERQKWNYVLAELRSLRNAVAYGSVEVTEQTAENFARGAANVLGYLALLIATREMAEYEPEPPPV